MRKDDNKHEDICYEATKRYHAGVLTPGIDHLRMPHAQYESHFQSRCFRNERIAFTCYRPCFYDNKIPTSRQKLNRTSNINVPSLIRPLKAVDDKIYPTAK